MSVENMRVEKILLIDNSGSTIGADKYWRNVNEVAESKNFDVISCWSSQCEDVNSVKEIQPGGGGTYPICFMNSLKDKYEHVKNINLELTITTDGEISDYDIDKCSAQKFVNTLEKVSRTTIYYFGDESAMNIGLNVIFGSTSELNYYINSTTQLDTVYSLEQYVGELDTAPLNRLLDEKFLIGFTTRMQKTVRSNKCDKNELTRLRITICKAFDRLKKFDKVDELSELYKNRRAKEYSDMVYSFMMQNETKELDRYKNRLINSLDKTALLRIDHLRSCEQICSNSLVEKTTLEEDTDSIWKSFTDEITFDNLDSLPCLLMQDDRVSEINIDSKKCILHPFEILRSENADVVDRLVSSFENHVVSFKTVVKIGVNALSVVNSPFTRQNCWVFILAPREYVHLKYNARAISRLFGKEFKIPGNLTLWHFIFVYIICKRIQLEENILQELLTFCHTFTVSITLSVKCSIANTVLVRLEEALWFCCRVAPIYHKNSVLNVLRNSWGLELERVYEDLYREKEPNILKNICIWRAWSYLIQNRGVPRVELEVQAQYQNYKTIKYENDEKFLILLSGECEQRYPHEIFNAVEDVCDLYTLFKNCKDSSKNLENLDLLPRFICNPVMEEMNDGSEKEKLRHVTINPVTCWPYVICKVTGKHWQECIGTFNVQKCSLIRLFFRYCSKKKKYPTTHFDLMGFYFVVIRFKPIDLQLEEDFEYVFSIFKEVMDKYTVDEYLQIYKKFLGEKKFSGEKMRLQYE